MKEKKEKKKVQDDDAVKETSDKQSNDSDELEKLKNELLSEKEKFLRIAAEYDNYRKRTERDKSSIYHDAISKTITEILPVADSLNMAVKSKDGENADYKKGLELVNNQFIASLEKLSVESFGEPGEKFDPEIHNAIAHVDDEELEENVITDVFQLGYKVGDKIIRHAMVRVAN